MWYEQNVVHGAQLSVSVISQTHFDLIFYLSLNGPKATYIVIYDKEHHIVDGDVVYVYEPMKMCV